MEGPLRWQSGVKRARKDRVVFTYQGDGDLASIGIAEVIHTANRGENITIFFANNTVYGMTGGQMAPTTLLGQKTTTSPYGRDFTYDGYPIRMAEMLATLEGCAFVARVAVNNPANLMKAKKAVRKAFQMQVEEMGFSFVEILLACPTNWGMNALEANRRVEEEMIPYFPLGIFKERKMADSLCNLRFTLEPDRRIHNRLISLVIGPLSDHLERNLVIGN